MKWNRASYKTCVSTLRDNSNHLLVAVLEAFRNLLSGSWSENNRALSLVLLRDILHMHNDFFRLSEHIFGADEILELEYVLLGYHFVDQIPLLLDVNSLLCLRNERSSSCWLL